MCARVVDVFLYGQFDEAVSTTKSLIYLGLISLVRAVVVRLGPSSCSVRMSLLAIDSDAECQEIDLCLVLKLEKKKN